MPPRSVLVAGPDWHRGSREHAVWALMNYGFRVVISSRFADIFRGNSGKQGLLTAQVAQDDAELLWKYLENEPGASVTVDLVSRTVTAGDIVAPFTVDDYTLAADGETSTTSGSPCATSRPSRPSRVTGPPTSPRPRSPEPRLTTAGLRRFAACPAQIFPAAARRAASVGSEALTRLCRPARGRLLRLAS